MLSKTNTYQRSYRTQRCPQEKRSFSCVVYIEEPAKYSIIESKRLIDVDERGYGTIKELGKSYGVHVEQTGTQESMERYGRLLEKAMQSQMHEDIPSDCEEWISKKAKEDQSKHSKAASILDIKSPVIQQIQSPLSNEISLRKMAFDETLSSPGHALCQESSPFSRTYASLNIEQEATIHIPAEATSDDDSSYAVEENEDSDEEIVTKKTTSSNLASSRRTATKSKKRLITQQIPFSKRLRFSTNDHEEQRENEHLNLQQILDHMKEVNSNLLKLQKQQQNTKIAVDRQDNFLTTLCKNQRKLAKSFNKRRIMITLDDGNQNQDTDEEQLDNQNMTYTRSDGVVVDLLSVSGDKQNTIKYALKLIDALFMNKQDFQNINVKKADEDPRIQCIYKAVMKKFHYSSIDMSVVWPPIHDSILSKRRNQQKSLKSSMNTSLIQQSTSTPSPSQQQQQYLSINDLNEHSSL